MIKTVQDIALLLLAITFSIAISGLTILGILAFINNYWRKK